MKTTVAAAWFIIGGLVWLVSFVGVIYVVAHFVAKYW